MCGNHDAMAEDSRLLFLECDHEAMIRKFQLKSDEAALYMQFLNETYRIDRKTGTILQAETKQKAEHDVLMPMFDMLCYSREQKELPVLSGTWQNLSVLGGIIGAGHVKRLHTDEVMAPFLGKTKELAEALRSLGGTEKKGGDVSFVLPVFPFFPVWVQFWDADEEFPANLQFLWDRNSLAFVHYETLFYATSYLERLLAEAIQR